MKHIISSNTTSPKRSVMGRFSLVVSLLVMTFLSNIAMASLLIWPTRVHVDPKERSASVNIENQSNKEQLFQARVFLWSIKDGKEQYIPQEGVMVSPPMVKVPANSKQMFRVVLRTPTPPDTTATYRVILDEIPQKVKPSSTGGSDISQAIQFQFRYSVPVFVHGAGLSNDKRLKLSGEEVSQKLSWRVAQEGGRKWLYITNRDRYYHYLTNISIGSEKESTNVGGYLLPNSTVKLELPKDSPVTGKLYGTLERDRKVVVP